MEVSSSLRIVITTSDEPIVLNQFVRCLIEARPAQIIGLGLIERQGSYARGLARKNRKTRRKGGTAPVGGTMQSLRRAMAGAVQSARGLLSILLIYGIRPTATQLVRLLAFRLQVLLHGLGLTARSPSIAATAAGYHIPVLRAADINDRAFREELQKLRPDIIINQAPGILRAEFLSIPAIGVLNRHNALLPRHRGRLSTFWAIYHGDARTGVTVHFVIEKLDAGLIVAQREVPIGPDETVHGLAARCYAIAPAVMLEAIDKLERGVTAFGANPDAEATYNTNPALTDAIRYRWRRISAFSRSVQSRVWL